MKISVLLAVVLLAQTETASGVNFKYKFIRPTKGPDASNLVWVDAIDGKVPKYAVAGGTNNKGEVLYVAKASVAGSGETPGRLEPSSRMAFVTVKQKELYRPRYKVLTNPGWKSKLSWKKFSGGSPVEVPKGAVIGAYSIRTPLYVGRIMYGGNMVPGKAEINEYYQVVKIGSNGNEIVGREFYLLVEHKVSGRKRGFSSRFEYHDLPGVEPLKRAPILDQ